MLRGFSAVLMLLTGIALLLGSTFALRMRADLPVQGMAVGLSVLLAGLPLVVGRRHLNTLLVCAWLLAGIGGYWWTTVPWDELLKDSGFPASEAPGFLDYALVASPAVVAAFYAVVSRPSLLRADLKTRGADPDEIRVATGTSFLSGAVLLVFCGALAASLWLLMATRVVFAAVAPVPRGFPALILVGALVTVAYALLAGRLPRPPGLATLRARLRRTPEAAR